MITIHILKKTRKNNEKTNVIFCEDYEGPFRFSFAIISQSHFDYSIRFNFKSHENHCLLNLFYVSLVFYFDFLLIMLNKVVFERYQHDKAVGHGDATKKQCSDAFYLIANYFIHTFMSNV